MRDFFISYNKNDKRWAEWIAYQLEEWGYTTVIQAWDFRPGGNFVLEMHRAAVGTDRTIVVLSQNYLAAEYTQSEWAAAFVKDPKGIERKLVPVRVAQCRPEGLLASIIYIDLVEKDEPGAVEALSAGISKDRAKPEASPAFPGQPLSGPATGQPKPEFPASLSVRTNVPYSRNPFFTGREDVLKRLRETLVSSGRVALSGLGGIGKTQTAVEYAHRYREDYQAVLWAKADPREALVSGFVAIAGVLNLPEKDAQDQNFAVVAVRRWLEFNTDWLLIFDNADDLAMARELIPSGEKGHVLLTTRAQATGAIAQRVEIEQMEPKEGALFLLRRAKLIAKDAPLDQASDTDRRQAEKISSELGGLPLALDQAGAYIEETGSGLSDYLILCRTHGAELLKRRGAMASDHPDPVATTFVLSFEKVENASAAAAELLRFCAFLHPDSIREELINEGASELGPVLQPVAGDSFELNTAIGEILKYSLLRRDPTAKTVDIHRLVQAVLRDGMNGATHRQWAERAVRAVNQAFPAVEVSMWPRCEEFLPHAQACAELIERWNFEFQEAARLLNQTAFYLDERARYAEAESLYMRALAIREKAVGPEHPDVAQSLNNLAALYHAQGRYAEAEPLLQRALAIREKVFGPEHPNVATSLNNLAALYRVQGRYVEAEPLYMRALAIREKVLGPEHPDVASSLNNLAALYHARGRYAEAEPLYMRALAIREKVLGPEHPNVATSLNNLAALYRVQGRNAEAESLYQRALAIFEKVFGPEHPNVATSLNNLAALYRVQGRYVEAEPLLQRALAIREKVLGPEHPDVAQSLNNLALLDDAQGRYAEAQPLFERALGIWEKALGPEHPEVATCLGNYAALLRKRDRKAEAAKMEARARAIRAKHVQENPRN